MILQRALDRANVTRAVDVRRGALQNLPDLIRGLGGPTTCRIVADPSTMRAAGAAAQDILRAAGFSLHEPIILDGSPRPKPRAETSRELAHELREDLLPIAVGSGVLNDLTKHAAELARRPYLSIATAASMDGYAASGAALLDRGFKRTLACAPPIAVVADLDVLCAAPARMAGWGYGDLAGKLVAGADWVLADALGEEAIAPVPFGLVQDHLRGWLADAEGVASASRDALRALIDGLLVAGLAMQDYGSSRPASGCEHQISHVWEMEGLARDGVPVAHGACVGVGTVAMLALYEWFLAQDVQVRALARRDAPPVDPDAADAEARAAFAMPALAEAAQAEIAAKLERAGARVARLAALAQDWPGLRARLAERLVPAATLQGRLVACGAAAHPADLGLSLAALARDCRRARVIRRRYTLLDALDDLGWLDRGIAACFAPDGFWGRQQASRAPTASAETPAAPGQRVGWPGGSSGLPTLE